MTRPQKQAAAAIGAVLHYMRAEEESALITGAAPASPPCPPPGPALWALNGRQTQMQLRNLMQLRALGRMG
jgi:hypothetical protein